MNAPADVFPILNPNWPEAEWDVSGAFSNDRELLILHDYFRQVFGVNIIRTVHGAPLCLWNSGRVLPKFACTAEQIRDAAVGYLKRGIAVDLTFSNHLLDAADCDNTLGNTMLKFFDTNNPTKRNAVIISSDALYDHVKKNFPKLKLVSSIVKISVENGRGKLDAYRKLAERFDKVMVHPDDSCNFDLLEKLEDKSRYEILVNEYCVRGCKLRPLHYASLSKLSKDYFGTDTSKFEAMMAKNGCSDLVHILTHPEHGVAALSQEEIRRLYEMGFRKFKVQGRGMTNAAGSVFDVIRLALREDEPGDNFMFTVKTRFLEALSTLVPAI